jgi:hypothetical protein
MTALGHVESLPSIQNQSPWVRDGEPICPRCHWPVDSVGHVVNCEVSA